MLKRRSSLSTWLSSGTQQSTGQTAAHCGACEPECPNNAIYEAAVDWKYSEGTSLTGSIVNVDGIEFDADAVQDPVSDEVYYIVPDKCTECKGFHEEPQ